jgi:hypothetical protein
MYSWFRIILYIFISTWLIGCSEYDLPEEVPVLKADFVIQKSRDFAPAAIGVVNLSEEADFYR